MTKKRKKLKILLIVIASVFVCLVVSGIITLNSPSIQSFLAKKGTTFLASRFEINLNIDKLYYKFPNIIVFEKLDLKDSLSNDLLATDKIFIKVGSINIRNKIFSINEIKIFEPNVNLYTDKNGNTNISYVINKFISEEEDTTKTEFTFKCKKFTLDNAIFTYKDWREEIENTDSTFNPNDFKIKGITTSFSDFAFLADTLSVNILHFSCAEKFSGLAINNLSGRYKYYDKGMVLEDCNLFVNNTNLWSNHLEISGKDDSYLSDPLKKMSVKANIDSLIFDVADLAPFLPQYRNIHEKIFLSGKLSGKFSNIKLNALNIILGKHTNINGNFSIDGLPDYNQTFIFGDITNLNTDINDVQEIMRIASTRNTIKLPKNLQALTRINFKGNLTGLISDFVAYGQLNTNLGSVRTDLAIVSDFEKKKYNLNGKVVANEIQLDKILDDTVNFGNISFNTTVNGYLADNDIYNFKANCEVSQMELYGYNYSNIYIDGDIKNNFFDGKIKIEDENINFNFNGTYKFSNDFKTNDLKFRSELTANLSALHLLADSLNSNLQLSINSDIRGDFTGFPEGKININNVKFTYNDNIIKLSRFVLNSFKEKEQQFFTVRSDLCNLNLYGSFNFTETFNKIQHILYSYLPAVFDSIPEPQLTMVNKFNYDIQLIDIDKITQVLLPQLSVPDDFFAEGVFNSENSKITAFINIPQIKYDSIYLWGNQIDLKGINDSLNINFSNQEISSIKKPFFENLNLKASLKNNATFLNFIWDNYDTLQNSGNFKIKTIFTKLENQDFPLIENTFYKSDIVINNIKWLFYESNIDVNPNDLELKIKNFKIEHDNQFLVLNGAVSKDIQKILSCDVKNINIDILNPFLEASGYQISGLLNGKAMVSNVYQSMSLDSKLFIDTLKVNDFEFGRVIFIGKKEQQKDDFKLTLENTEYFKSFKIIYSPKTENIDVDINIINFPINVLNPLMNSAGISKLGGNVNIKAKSSGNLTKPQVEGEIEFDNTQLTYNMLNFTAFIENKSKIKITNNAFLLNNFKIKDEHNNTGIINGGLYHNNFKDFSFNFLIHTNKLKVMNTTIKDNDMYYGTVFVTGDVKIAGNTNSFGIDIDAKTDEKTVFVLPMSSMYESNAVSYLTFVKKDTVKNEKREEIKPKSNINLYLKMDVEVTPDATVQIDFDPKIGDVIRANAKGNLKMEYDSNDEMFYMYGETEITNGNYLFTLENVINKKFTIGQGSTLTWTGDPTNAQLNLNAIYKTRTSLKDLFTDVTESEEMYKTVDVECKMFLTGSLMKPDIEFNIEVPNASETAKSQLATLSKDDINKQFVFLLILNRFFNQNQNATGENKMSTIGSTAGNALSATSFELLSNQINNWLSQISNDFDIGFKYQPGSEVSGQEFEMAMSTQVLNDRLLINGNVGYGDNIRTNTSSIVGDLEVQYKISPSGNFRIKGFSRKNDELETEYGPFTYGAGVFYTKEFDTFKEMISDIWSKVTFKNYREKKKNNKTEEKK